MQDDDQTNVLPISFVPTPSQAYRIHRKTLKSTVQPGPVAPSAGPIPTPVPLPLPFLRGSRVLMWKQDPSVREIGIRKAFLPNFITAGPRDARIEIKGLPSVSPNVFGDFIESPGTDAFDSVHTFSVVRETLTMYQRALAGAALPWQWNSATNADRLSVFPHAGVTQNAFYSRDEKALKFFFFDTSTPPPSHQVFTCRSFDIVAHETGHAVLDGLKPHWLDFANPPQTGGLHESVGDLTAIFLALSQFDQVEAIIAQTKANLHDKTFLADLAEEFGLALGRPNGLRNADNDLKLSEVGTEVHAISQVFTGAVYDVLADIFAFERKPGRKDDAATLYDAGKYLFSLLVRAIIAAPASAATFADVANQMLVIANADGAPVQYRNFIRNRFTVREVVVSPTPLSVDHDAKQPLQAVAHETSGVQDRRTCCGTMNLDEYCGGAAALKQEQDDLMKSLAAPTTKAAE
jgi:hypothetical protein